MTDSNQASEPHQRFFDELDWFDPRHCAHLDDELGWARTHCPVVHTGFNGGMYVVTRYADLVTMAAHPEIFSSTVPGLTSVPVAIPPIDLDPPLHSDFRAFLNGPFSRESLKRYRPVIEELADELIDGFVDAGSVEFVGEFAIPYTAGALAKVVLEDEDPQRLRRAIEVTTEVSVTNSPESFGALAAMAAEVLAHREVDPRDDFLSSLVTATVEGGRALSMEERLGVVSVLMLGGLDTTRGLLAYIAKFLTEDQNLETRLRQPDWVRSDLDEILRLTSTVSVMGRVVMQDNDLLGVSLTKGDRVAVHWRSANRDASRFEDPDRLDFDRNRNPHLAFGVGIHRCLGRHFARMQTEIAVDRLLNRLTNLRVVSGSPQHPAVGISIGAPEQLHLEFDRVGSPA
ncbi:cytochrome P450 [Nocardia alni]|uniref:cytochrome P450 n=1 Tax=Nocardia alni TaxID=2815723 RepID=UPI001C22D423|nr:cytochrome P450 [Nocardia alni]